MPESIDKRFFHSVHPNVIQFPRAVMISIIIVVPTFHNKRIKNPNNYWRMDYIVVFGWYGVLYMIVNP